MKKDLLEEMIEALTELRNNQKKISIPVPPKPDEVFRVIGKVAKEHEVTSSEMMTMMALRNTIQNDSGEMIAEDMKTAQALAEQE